MVIDIESKHLRNVCLLTHLSALIIIVTTIVIIILYFFSCFIVIPLTHYCHYRTMAINHKVHDFYFYTFFFVCSF